MGDGRPGDDHTVRSEEQDAAVAELGGDAVALAVVEGETVVVVVIGDVLVEAERVLFDGFQPPALDQGRSEEHTSELQSLMRISYAVFCLKKKTKPRITIKGTHT